MADAKDSETKQPKATRRRQPRQGDLWTLRDVGRRLTCADETAARWLEKHNVARYDIGTGSRDEIRVKPADVEAALEGCLVSGTPAAATHERHERGYTPKYRPSRSDGGAVTSSR
ncbi:MAG TPA: hypothetical protein VGN72_19880 [Tepidisphaeraceae bacterium]|nr:hypothetical protein [Tepidisphaeraceae bacterium]